MESSDARRPEMIVQELMVLADRMAATMYRFTAKQMNRYDLSPNRYNALRSLGDDEQLPMSALAERLKVSTAAVTSIVDKLEAEKLVRRTRSKKDRRQVFVQITKNGREAMERVISCRADLIHYLLVNMPAHMQQHWLDLYREIDRLFDRRVAEAEQDTTEAQQ